jgi:hypothetical protein
MNTLAAVPLRAALFEGPNGSGVKNPLNGQRAVDGHLRRREGEFETIVPE